MREYDYGKDGADDMSVKKPTEPSEVVHVKLPRALVKTIDHLAVERECFRHDAMVLLLEAGLQSLGFTWPPADKPMPIPNVYR